MLVDLLSATPLPDFQLDLVYKNGERRRFDMRPLLKLRPWSQIASAHQFERVEVAYGSVMWPGEIDIAPETLYDDSTPLAAELGCCLTGDDGPTTSPHRQPRP